MKKLGPWCLAAIATLASFGAAGGTSGALAGHTAILAVTLGIFVGTLSLNRTPSGSTSSAVINATSTPTLLESRSPAAK